MKSFTLQKGNKNTFASQTSLEQKSLAFSEQPWEARTKQTQLISSPLNPRQSSSCAKVQDYPDIVNKIQESVHYLTSVHYEHQINSIITLASYIYAVE